MKANFINNLNRIKFDIRRYSRGIWELNWFWKIILLLILFFIAPVLQVGMTSIVPLIATLFFINNDLKGKKRGILAFALGTISQLFVILMIFSLLAFNDISRVAGLATIISATLSGMLMLVPGYALAFLFYGINPKEVDGKIYVIMYGILGIVLAIWNTFAVLTA